MAAAQRRRLPSLRFLLTLLIVAALAIALATHARHRGTAPTNAPSGVGRSGSPHPSR